MKTKSVYIVTYNDRYGNGDEKNLEGIIAKREDFGKWLFQHNLEREIDGNPPESSDEFDVECASLFSFTKRDKVECNHDLDDVEDNEDGMQYCTKCGKLFDEDGVGIQAK